MILGLRRHALCCPRGKKDDDARNEGQPKERLPDHGEQDAQKPGRQKPNDPFEVEPAAEPRKSLVGKRSVPVSHNQKPFYSAAAASRSRAT